MGLSAASRRAGGRSSIAIVIEFAICLMVVLTGCSSSSPSGRSSEGSSGADRISVVASLYPLQYVIERVGADRVKVVNLTPPGAEPHDLELSPSQLEKIDTAAFVVVLGKGFQPSAEKAAVNRSGPTLTALDVILDTTSKNVDPHVWLDPSLLRPLVDAVAERLIAADEASKELFVANAAALKRDLVDLDTRLTEGLASCERRTIVTSHDAFARLAQRYRLTNEGIAGFSPDAEPSPDRLAALAKLVKQTGTTTVFTEQLVSPAVAETLARETGAAVEILNPIEGRPKTGDYLSAMNDNLAKLRTALACK